MRSFALGFEDEALFENAVYLRRDSTCFGRQTHIAARQCEAVCFADNGAGHYFEVETFELHHASDNCYLLKVFLAEICTCGLCECKELAHYLGNAVEVTWTHGAFHYFGNRAEVENPGVGFGIYFVYRWHEDIVHTAGFEHGAVGLFGSWVRAEVVGIVELSGVYKNTHHYYVVFVAGTLYE